MSTEAGSAEGDRLDQSVTLVAVYERRKGHSPGHDLVEFMQVSPCADTELELERATDLPRKDAR